MADLQIHVLDTHVQLIFAIKNQDSETVDLTGSACTFLARPEQEDEISKACAINTPVDSGTNATTTGSAFTESGQNFQTTINVGDLLVITAGNDIGSYLVTAVTSDTELAVVETFVGDTSKAWYITDGTLTVNPSANMFDSFDQEARVKIVWGDTTESYTVTQFIVEGLT